MQVDLTPFLSAHRGEHTLTWMLSLPAGPVEGLGRQAAVAASAPVAVTAHGDAQRLLLEVETSFVLDCPCDRCLQTVARPVALHYTEALTLRREGQGRRGADPDLVALAAESEDDPAPRPVDPSSFSLDDGLWQHTAFALPAKLLCRPDCRGLCPRCGADRNRTPCTCREPDPDPRLAALSQWRGRNTPLPR